VWCGREGCTGTTDVHPGLLPCCLEIIVIIVYYLTSEAEEVVVVIAVE